ncbi:uncharacterized protein [Procambarus clarkii]|uniref:uncharacterized protein n=1 Tax=Procambarus clarkii TaxID=6728 RepID=UPI003743D834
MKLKLELAKLEREQRKEEAAIKKEEQEREAALAKEALQLRKEEAAMRKEEQERETVLLRRRERVQLEAKHRHLEMQREHDKNKHLYPGTVSTNCIDSEGSFKLKILRDTAALQSIMLKSAVSNVTYTGETVLITDLTATTPSILP